MRYNLKTWQTKEIQRNMADPWEITVVSGQVMLHTIAVLEQGESFHRGHLLNGGRSGVISSWVDFRVIAYIPSTIELKRK